MAPSGEHDRSDDETVVSPEELDIAAAENVEQLDEGRFVIGADGPPNRESIEARRASIAAEAEADAATATKAATVTKAAAAEEAATAVDAATAAEAAAPGENPAAATDADTGSAAVASSTASPAESGEPSEITGMDVKRWLTDELTGSDSRYAYRIAAKTGDAVRHQQLASDDIGVAFDSLLLWYARQVGKGTPVEEALGILLAESDIRVRYPTPRLLDYLDEHDLGPDDSIADLVNAVHEEDGLVFPQRRNQS